MRLLKGRFVASGKTGMIKAPVFSIQHFCLHDGPGIRSIVFFKGCPLRCAWCQNPESWVKQPELAFKAHLCVGCNTCVEACPRKAYQSPGIRDETACDLCFTCADQCPSAALVRFGAYRSIDDIIDELEVEYSFYKDSGGGVTFSGGEPTLFPGFAARLTRALKNDGIHVAVETCGMFHSGEAGTESGGIENSVWDFLLSTDLIIFDVKLFDDVMHQRYCGTGNAIIKDNLKQLAAVKESKSAPDVWVRMPVIPGITDTNDNLSGWADFLKETHFSGITLVPYHNMGDAKRSWLNIAPGPVLPSLTDETMNEVRRFFARSGIACYDPGEEKR